MNISEIAQLAGVSPSAVSRYLNNGYLSVEKKAAIAKVIEETGYIPSSQAQTLRTRKTKLIGVIIPKIDSDSISQVVAGINEVLLAHGYQMLLTDTENTAEKELEFIHTFSQRMVDGIILLGTILTPRHKAVIKSLRIPLVVLGQSCHYASSIYHDDYHAAAAITEYMIESGRKKIGYIGVPEKDIAVGKERRQGYLDTLKKYDLEVSETMIRTGSFHIENGYDNTPLLLDANPDTDAIICATDTIALGAIKYLNQQKIAIPDQIAISGFGDSKVSAILSPSLTTVHFYYRECGIEGAKILLEKIEKPNTPDKSLKLGFELLKNESVESEICEP